MNRYFAYCRKSEEAEDRQVLSIESQRDELKRFAEREQLSILEFFEEARSAKVPGRPIFNQMMERIRRGEADGIVSWHPDRLARNSVDSGQITYSLDIEHLRDLKFPTYTFENTPTGKFILGITFTQSKYYVDKLSEDVRRGNRKKRDLGWHPNLAPVGYLNGRSEIGEKIIVPDPARFPIVKKVWECMLSGAYSVPQLRDVARDELRLKTKPRRKIGGNPLSRTGLYKMLSSPFYAGYLVYKGKWFKARHEPMITMQEFEKVQRLLGRSDRSRPKKHEFTYTGLMQCGFCGYSVTADRHVNRYGYEYIYYHCTYKNPKIVCRERCVQQKELEKQLLKFLDSIYVDDAMLEAVMEQLKAEQATSAESAGVARQSVQQELERCERELQNLVRMCRRDLITETEFETQKKELLQQQLSLRERMERANSENWIEPAKKLFFFANRAKYWLTHGTEDQKRQIAATVGSNLLLQSKKLHIDAKEPFRILMQHASGSLLCTAVSDVRTFFQANLAFQIPVLPEATLSTIAA